MQEQFSKPLKDYDSDGYASVRSKVFESFNQLSSSGYVDWNTVFARLNEVNKELENKGFPKYSLNTDTQIDMAKFLVGNGYIALNPSIEFQNKVYKEHYDELSSIFNLTPEMSLQEANIEMQRSLLESPENINSITERLLDINNKLKNEEALEEDDLQFITTLGINLIEENGSLSNQTNIANIENSISGYNDYSINLRKIYKTRKDAYDKFVNNSSKETLHENFKEVVYSFLSGVGIPATGADPETLQVLIDKFLPQFIQQLDESNNLAQADENKSDEEKAKFQEDTDIIKVILNNLLVTKKFDQEELNISAKRQLLLEYGRQLKDSNSAVDSVFLDELEKEYKEIEHIINKNRTNYEAGDAIDSLFNELSAFDELIKYSKENLKINQLLEMLKKFEFSLLGFKGPESFFQVIQNNIDDFSNNVVLKSDFIRSDLQIQQMERASYVIEGVNAVLNSMSTSGLSDGNLYGMNVLMNKYLEKKGEAPKYEFVDDYTAEIIRKDLNIIKSKIDYLLNLARNNAVSLVDNDNKVKDKYLEVMQKQYLDKEFNLSLVNLTFNGKPIFTSDDLEKYNNIENLEQRIIEVEEDFYNKFYSLPGNTSEKLDILFQNFIKSNDLYKSGKDIIESPDSTLTSDFTGFELID